jgi:hypothetical protein
MIGNNVILYGAPMLRSLAGASGAPPEGEISGGPAYWFVSLLSFLISYLPG